MAINKVIYGNDTLIDLTGDTVSSSNLLSGALAHNAAGLQVQGSVIVPQPAINLPANLGTAAVGSSSRFALEDHVHSMPSASDVGALPVGTAIPSKVSDLTNDSGFITGMTILSYGSSTWQDFLSAYSSNKVVYCRASSGADPSQGDQKRLAFLAYVNDPTSPTSVEFQYYRSISTHSLDQQGDQVYIYTLSSSGTWSVTVREASTKIAVGNGLISSYNNDQLSITCTGLFKLLWTNPTQTNNFASQTISINISSYSYILVLFAQSTGNDNAFKHFVYNLKGTGSSCLMTDLDLTATDLYIYKRDFISLSNSSGVLFGDCQKRKLNSTSDTGAVDNSHLIPCYILAATGI